MSEFRRSRWRPRSWPLAVKLALAMAAAALLPLLTVSYYNLRTGLEAAAADEAAEMEHLADGAGQRIDQLIASTRHTIAYLAWSQAVIQLASTSDPAARERVEDQMARLIAAVEAIELFMVLDSKGVVLASSMADLVGRELGFRDYFKRAMQDAAFVSNLEVGITTHTPGVYFSVPVRGPTGRIAGVAVLKLKAAAIGALVDKAGDRKAGQLAYLVDEHGVIIYHPDPRALYRSLGPLAAELQRKLVQEKRFGTEVEAVRAFDFGKLADDIVEARRPGHASYFSPITAKREMMGYAPLAEVGWRVVVSEPEEVYLQPLETLFFNAVRSVGLAGAVFIIFAILFARSFTRPLTALTGAARAVEKGDLEKAKVTVVAQDELGRFALTFNDMVEGIKAREHERDVFGRMVSPEVREKLLSGGLKLGGENRRVSVLFSDIRGFSTLSEKMSPQDVVALLNDYLTEMTEAVRPWGGYVNNFIGDAIVVVFGAPEAQADTEWNAVCAARDMRLRLDNLNRRRRELGDVPLVSGIGISTGKVVAGQVGSLERFMYTVIGDAVNVAARLESLTREFEGNPVLMNAATWQACQDRLGGMAVIDQGPCPVKGREDPVHVYALYVGAEAPGQALRSGSANRAEGESALQ